MIVSVSVVLPTIGRPALVRQCLESLATCEPQAGEILIIDSSPNDGVERVVADFASTRARVLRCDEPGLGTAFNRGLRAAVHELVLLTNDDCTVDGSWIGVGEQLISTAPIGTIVTGRVKPFGDPEVVPSTIDDPTRREHVGDPGFFLYTQCMAVRRDEVLDFGAFDGRIQPSAEDNDLSYRWLRSRRRILYEPEFVVWHHDWRTREQLERLYVSYGVGQGMVYAKHLRRGDTAVAHFVARDIYAICRGLAGRVVRGRSAFVDWRLGFARGLPVGLARGWRAYGRAGRSTGAR